MAPESAWFKSSYSDSQGGACVEIAALFPEHAWHKSSYSDGAGNNCVEVAAPIAEHMWKKSSYSDSQGGSCVEVAALPARVGIRDSKDKQGPALLVPTPAWRDFVAFAAGPIISE
ncbi:DUF397 domain-containing protein [Streptomyces katsurahamanus]|uniref:DUF397 domain-containing protein n=1 Tax=Streptomyces katsurahamanus TaxID=2577098 RepID=A0ABW9P2S5_9ACTN|nr:DUF397 domain-containing protein [Streptomyces katsurahamanus]MQS39805.1 DUF397 domain-containing protein [Streptomyces katsurahamanus]